MFLFCSRPLVLHFAPWCCRGEGLAFEGVVYGIKQFFYVEAEHLGGAGIEPGPELSNAKSCVWFPLSLSRFLPKRN